MDYHTYPDRNGNNTRFFVRSGKGGKTIEMRGRVRDLEPLVMKNAHDEIGGPYPAYSVITVNGVTDVVEHRHMEPVFYMTDDPAVWKAFNVGGTSQTTH
ncbi:MAG: hypothetical protein ABI132_08750 [Rhodanobacteraceae bacterium]